MINCVRGFKTVVINGQKLRIAIILLLTVTVIAIVSALAAMVSGGAHKSASSESFYEAIISAQLHNENKKPPIKKILNSLLGCDISDAKSIIAKNLPAFSEEFAPTPSPSPSAEPDNDKSETSPKPETKPIREAQSKSDMTISNRTSISVNPNALADEALCFSLEKTDQPQVLIFHTHTTESYTDSNTNVYITGSSDRNLDEQKNVSAVGEAMTEVFENAGIAVIHDKTVHDYPSFNGAYTRSLATVKANLANNPKIRIVLDIHRDGIVKEDGTKVKVAADINGEKTAQCMFVVGSNANLTHDNWLENMKLACKIQRLANEMYPGLMRPIILREERFNQQVSTGSLIIEVGSNGNTLEEAVRGGRYMADVIAKLLKN